jgi:hypothetical protein
VPWWLRIWARAGIRNWIQRPKGLTADETARDNRRFLDTKVNYLPKAEIRRSFGRHFATVTFAESAMLKSTEGRSRILRPVAGVAGPLRARPASGPGSSTA